MEAEAPSPFLAAGAELGPVCALEASIHLRRRLVMVCWSSRAAAEVNWRV